MATQVNISFTVNKDTHILDIVEHVQKIALRVDGVHMQIGADDATLGPRVVETAEPEAPAPAPAAKKKTKKKASKKAEPTKVEQEQEEPAPNPNFRAHTVDEVRDALSTLMRERGGATARELLSEFNAANVSALYEEQYGDVITRVKELLR